jgi:hypothetical protein
VCGTGKAKLRSEGVDIKGEKKQKGQNRTQHFPGVSVLCDHQKLGLWKTLPSVPAAPLHESTRPHCPTPSWHFDTTTRRNMDLMADIAFRVDGLPNPHRQEANEGLQEASV